MLINDHPECFSLANHAQSIAAEDYLLVFQGENVLLRGTDENARLPRWQELMRLPVPMYPLQVFSYGDQNVFLINIEQVIDVPDGLAFSSVRVFRLMADQEEAFLLSVAYHLSIWYGKHRYCGVCGGKMQPSDTERALICGQCRNTLYPTISPAVIIAITDNDRILLARNAYGVFRHFSLIAGYVEVGETLEQAAQREILEEVGLRVRNLRYLASQPWGLSHSLMIGYHAELDGSPEIVLQQSELAEARWFGRDELPEHASPASIAFEIIERFRRNEL